MKQVKVPVKQKGVALAIALILLIGVTVVSLASLNTSLLELVMAGSNEARMTAFQKAQAGLDAVQKQLCDDYTGFFAPFGSLGYTSCTGGGFDGESCDDTSLVTPTDFASMDGVADVQILVSRIGQTKRQGPRGDDEVSPDDFNTVTCQLGYKPSSYAKDYATLMADSKFDGIVKRGGRARVSQGYMVELATSSDDGPVWINFDPSVP